jgi:Zn-dependent peptidase ImmA (M78 family)
MRKIPKSITILGRTIKIKTGKNLYFQGEPCLGLCDYDNRIIYLEQNQSPQCMKDTLCHEAVHFFLILCGMDQRMSDSEVEMYCQLVTALINDLS